MRTIRELRRACLWFIQEFRALEEYHEQVAKFLMLVSITAIALTSFSLARMEHIDGQKTKQPLGRSFAKTTVLAVLSVATSVLAGSMYTIATSMRVLSETERKRRALLTLLTYDGSDTTTFLIVLPQFDAPTSPDAKPPDSGRKDSRIPRTDVRKDINRAVHSFSHGMMSPVPRTSSSFLHR